MAPSQQKGEWGIAEIVKRHEDVPQSKIYQSGAGTHRTPKVEDLEFFIQKMAPSQKKGEWEIAEIVKRHEDVPQSKIFQSGARRTALRKISKRQ